MGQEKDLLVNEPKGASMNEHGGELEIILDIRDILVQVGHSIQGTIIEPFPGWPSPDESRPEFPIIVLRASDYPPLF